MRIRTAVAVSAVPAAAAALLLTAPPSQAAGPVQPAICARKVLTVRAEAAAADRTVVRVSVTNHGTRACLVDRVPTVTFGDLDGVALPVPATSGGTYALHVGRTAYADVRTISDPKDPEARRVPGIGVSASAYQWGRSFTAARLGTGREVVVWEPVTTWWQPTAAAADRAIGLS
ncbi:DUF4232 domain-containing protein [Streptomyces bungoensis]|uniref:DUF4232 domain-containing protein n=1 Tax=Streptomyces bungoensis TaxID=285568 RepID=UPI00343D7F93